MPCVKPFFEIKTKLRFLKNKRNVKLYLHDKTDMKTTFLFKFSDYLHSSSFMVFIYKMKLQTIVNSNQLLDQR